MNNLTKIFVFTIIVCLLQISVQAQTISVKSFTRLENDLEARINPVKDQNGQNCALIKIVTIYKGFTFEAGMMGVVKTDDSKNGEIWLYVPAQSQRITINHGELGSLRNYNYPVNIEQSTVYEMVLSTANLRTIVEQPVLRTGYILINSKPEGADVYINNIKKGTTPYSNLEEYGSYEYRLEKMYYYPTAGKVILDEGRKELPVTELKPNYGSLVVTSTPESGAEIFINNTRTNLRTPSTLDTIQSGEHTILVKHQWYKEKYENIKISDGQTINLEVKLEPVFANFFLEAEDSGIYINDARHGNNSFNGRLIPGVYAIEARRTNHETDKMVLRITEEDIGKTIRRSLHPRPLYGTLNIDSEPSGANIYIDGVERGVTPVVLHDVLIGNYTLMLEKQDYGNVNKEISVELNKTTAVNETLPEGISVEISSYPSGAEVFIDGKYKGVTPYNARLDRGEYSLELRKPNYKTIRTQIKNIYADKDFKEVFNLEHEERTINISTGDVVADVYFDGVFSGKTNQLIHLKAQQNGSIKVKSPETITYSSHISKGKDRKMNINLFPKGTTLVGGEIMYSQHNNSFFYGGNLGFTGGRFHLGFSGGIGIPPKDKFSIDITHQNIEAVSSSKYSEVGKYYVKDAQGYYFSAISGLFTYKPIKMFLNAGYGYSISPDFQRVYQANEDMRSGLFIPLNSGSYFTKPEITYFTSSYFITGISMPLLDNMMQFGFDIWFGDDKERFYTIKLQLVMPFFFRDINY